MREWSGDVEAKLALIRTAAGNTTVGREVDIETMLAKTEAARLADIETGMDADPSDDRDARRRLAE
jgi:hypothetical protein